MKWKFLKFGYMQLVKKEGEFSGLWWMKFRTLDSWGQVNWIRWNWKNFWEGLSCEILIIKDGSMVNVLGRLKSWKKDI